MLDISVELDKFRQEMRMRNRPENIISIIVREVEKEIVQSVDGIVGTYIDEAKAEGIAKGVDDFVEQLRATRFGSNYQITTDSGQTNFTVPPFPMLPKLLKNAKVAKDGSLYKVIPVKQNKKRKKAVSTIDIMKQINETRLADKQAKDAEKNIGGDVNFRTASSKQDANVKWVHPGKEGDMTQKLRDINGRMGTAIDRIIQETIDKHRGDWA